MDGLLLEIEEEVLDGNAQQNERSGFVSVEVAEKRFVNGAKHRLVHSGADPFAQQRHVTFRIGEKMKIIIQARGAEVREMDERKLQVQGVLAGGEDPANKKLPNDFLEQQGIRLSVGIRLLTEAGLDGMNVGLRFVPQDIEDPTSYGRLIHRFDMLPFSPRSVNRWLSNDRWARMNV